MTVIVGILCKDGVVIGTDSSATFADGTGAGTIEQPTDKVFIYENTAVMVGTGSVGINQRFREVMTRRWGMIKDFTALALAKDLSRHLIEDLIYTHASKGQYGALVAYPTKNEGFQLCEFEVTDLQPELKNANMWYVSMGSGQRITDPFLAFIRDVFWQAGPPTLQG